MSEPQEQEAQIQKSDLLIQQRIYDMILYAYPSLEQMPKSQKFSLAQDMKLCMDRIMRLTITANKKYTKRTTLQELDVEIAALKIYLRIAYDLRYLPPKKYEVWTGMLIEIGKMVGGWIRSQREAAEPPKADAEKRYCSECSEEIPEKAHQYSVKNFGRALCYKCQRKQRK
ncbi:diversity-generating retroelement protein Avd [Faecalibaculum rodentium]|uniref:diversity-generating retroelement protein Avd n=1 Tax=Faecalibaculum rodentium TaxID=1702221 RepID=UPI0026F3DEB7|nr:diversity-generating retroelement protein Avd [Faecalibaculum rodentium]